MRSKYLPMRSKFLTGLDLFRQPGSDGVYRLGADLGFLYAPYGCDQFEIWTKRGFITDGLSIPRSLRWFMSPFAGRHAAAAVLHDGLYQAQITSRTFADEILYEGMRAVGVPEYKCKLVYWAVRAFGWMAWDMKTSLSIQKAREFLIVRRKTL